jgi:hypothetical protein
MFLFCEFISKYVTAQGLETDEENSSAHKQYVLCGIRKILGKHRSVPMESIRGQLK